MKKIFLTTGILSVLTLPAMAETKWFIGGGLGYTGPILSDDLKNLIDDDFYKDESGTVSMYLNGGIRFGNHDKIYNGGVSMTLAYMPDLIKVKDGDANPYYMEGELDFTTLYLSYDNYIRISDNATYRTDFIISAGLGYGWINETLNIKGYGQETYKDDAMLIALKIGFGGETIITGLGWNLMANIIALNAKSDSDLQASFGIDFGLRYTF